jgi:hypothetical protein
MLRTLMEERLEFCYDSNETDRRFFKFAYDVWYI